MPNKAFIKMEEYKWVQIITKEMGLMHGYSQT